MRPALPSHGVYLLGHCLIGVIVAACFLAGLLILDVNGFGTLVLGSATPILAVAITFFGLVVTFGSVAMGAAIFLPPGADQSPDQEGGRRQLMPIRIAKGRRPEPQRR